MVPKTKSKTLEVAKKKSRDSVDPQLIRALGHPLRAHALGILNERTASPNELAKALGEGLSQVSYHVKVLSECGCIELVKTEPRRGAVEHYYRATAHAFLSDAEWAKLPASIREGMSGQLVQAIFNEVAAAFDVGTFDARDDRHVSWTPMVVDEEGWQEIVDATMDALERVYLIRTRSGERLEKRGEEGIRVSVSTLAFEAPEE